MVNFAPIDFQLGLPLNIKKIWPKNKFGQETNLAKNVAKMANFRPKIGQEATFALTNYFESDIR